MSGSEYLYIPNNVINGNLSLAAIGIYGQLLAFEQEGMPTTFKNLNNFSAGGEKVIAKALKELEENGYIKCPKSKDKNIKLLQK